MRGNVYDVVTSVLGIEGTVRADEYDFLCPVHPDRRPSAGVNLTTGLWHCMACGAGGDLASLVQAVRGTDRETALKLTRPSSPTALLATVQRAVGTILGSLGGKERAVPDLPTYVVTPSVSYLLDRGFTSETLKEYGVGYVERETLESKGRTISISDYASIPIRDVTGSLMAWCYRACHEGEPRYIYTPGARIGDLWFGEQTCSQSRSVVVTEGALDSMWVSQCGFPSLGLLGANAFNPAKTRTLLRFDSVVLFLDRDPAGAKATVRIGEEISHRVPTRIARYPRGSGAKDPQDLSPGEVRRAVERAVQFDVWNMGRSGVRIDPVKTDRKGR